MQDKLASLAGLVVSLAGVTAYAPRAKEEPRVPDLTQGQKADSHDWTLGPTGARGWIYTSSGRSAKARQILVTAVSRGSPADGILNTGDVIVGVDGRKFAGDARIEFASAIMMAVTPHPHPTQPPPPRNQISSAIIARTSKTLLTSSTIGETIK